MIPRYAFSPVAGRYQPAPKDESLASSDPLDHCPRENTRFFNTLLVVMETEDDANTREQSSL
jgi:hypothetical protein